MEESSGDPITTLYCPNSACIASSKRNIGLKRPLTELPVDPNHALLFCPFCDMSVAQCDGCYALIHNDDSSISTASFTTCRKCSMPNIRDESLRRSLGLPRTRSLTYDSIRTIQRSINAPLYAKYKSLELKRISESKDDTGDEYNVINSNLEEGSLSDSAFTNGARNVDSLDENIHQKTEGDKHTTNPKKRRREMDVNDEEDEDRISSAAGAGSRKRAAETEIADDNISPMRMESLPSANVGSGRLNFGRWRSRLNVPVAFMVTALRTQLKVLEARIAKAHDASAWSAMQWPQRGNRFLPVHATLLQSLYPMPASLSTSEIEMEITGDAVMSLDVTFFSRISTFLSERPSLLANKNTQKSPLEAVVSWVSAPHSQIQAEQAGISPAVFKSICNLIQAQNRHSESSGRAKSMPFLPLLQLTSNELHMLFSELLALERRLSSQKGAALENGMITTSSGQRGETSETGDAELVLPAPLSKVAPNALELTNAFEHQKFAVLLLMNLHSSLSATVL